MTNRQVVVWNLVAFGVFHLFLEVAFGGSGAAVIANYVISYWIIESKIDEKSKPDLASYTWLVSGCVFIIRCILGAMFLLMISA